MLYCFTDIAGAGIINCDPTFPTHFTVAAKAILALLLRKDPVIRLGTNGVAEIKETSFFYVIDFLSLTRKEATPPFKPDVHDETDTKYVPKTYLQAKPEDSIDTSVSMFTHSSLPQSVSRQYRRTQAKKHAKSDFSGFTFIPDSRP